MQQTYQRFIEALWHRPDRSELEAALGEASAALGLSRFAYLLYPSAKSAPLLISNYPTAWTRHYLRARYDRLDPVVRLARESAVPFEWGPDLRTGTGRHHERFFTEAARFGIRFGLTIPLQNSQAAMTFATDERQSRFLDSVERYRPALQLMSVIFHRHAAAALQPDHTINGVRLSPRELECLEWAARGKSASDTSGILGISRRTVSFHLENAKAKLGVRSIPQAVARLAAAGSPQTRPLYN
jgi:LuxR family transcriptional activator of conjugal transfer of Ti plasmids